MKQKLVMLLDTSMKNLNIFERIESKERKTINRCAKMRRKETKTVGIEPIIIEVMCLRLHEHETLSYLKDRGYSISPAEYYRVKKEIQDNTQSRLNQIGLEFASQHLERIDMLKLIQNELIEQYKNEQNPTKKANILMQLAELQQYLSSYYDSSSYVLERVAILKKRKQTIEQ